MTLPKTQETSSQGTAGELRPFGLAARNPFSVGDGLVQSDRFEMLNPQRGRKKKEGVEVLTFGIGSDPENVFVVGASVDLQRLTVPGWGNYRLGPVSAGLFDERAEGSAAVSAQFILDSLVQADADRLWAGGREATEEDDLESIKPALELFLKRHGAAGVRTFSRLLLGPIPSGQIAWTFLRMIGESVDAKTTKARRDLLAAALESRDAGLRYAAAMALGNFGDTDATQALRKRLHWEKNISVRRMIEAELRK